jgi:hypothetical protein
MPHVLVLGAGPAGLAAAIRLKERGGDDLDVTVLTQGHLLGGKASTIRDPEGYTWEHGFHVFFGWYKRLWGLLRRAGVDPDTAFIPNDGWSHFYDGPGQFDSIHMAVNPLVTWWRFTHAGSLGRADRRSMFKMAARWAFDRSWDPRIEDLDDLCFDAWGADMGLSEGVRRSARFRFTAEGYFNDPDPISAYVVMRSLQLLSKDKRAGEYFYQRVGLSEGVWDPLGAYFERLGGRIERYQKVVGLQLHNGRARAVQVARPDNRVHQCGGTWPDRIPVEADSHHWIEDFDAVVCTLPHSCIDELGEAAPDLVALPGLAGLSDLRDVVTLSVQVYPDRPLGNPKFGAVNGLAPPLPLAIDYQQIGGSWGPPGFQGGSMSWVGQLAGFEGQTDEQLLGLAWDAADKAGFAGASGRPSGRSRVRRNAPGYDRFTLTEPGAMRFRPRSDIGLANFFLAGDWVRNAVDIPCMEGAAASGFEVADHVLEAVRKGGR